MNSKKILVVEPFAGGSHGAWLRGLKDHSKHSISTLELSDRHWKWRMHGGAITLAEEFLALEKKPDAILFSDMMDVTTFLALTRKKTNCPTALYFHENQLTYPWSPIDREKTRKQHYEFINYASALAVDACFFNSQYHLDSFLSALRPFLKQFPEPRNLHTIDQIGSKCSVLPVGVTLPQIEEREYPASNPPRILWNHRWEYDKNPDDFFDLLRNLKNAEIPFRLVVLGESFETTPECFLAAEKEFAEEIDHFGYCDSKDEYWQWVLKSDYLPVTSHQEFFGISAVEAMYAGVFPLLPDRLAFPELLPETLHEQHLYDGTMQDLYTQLVSQMKAPIAPHKDCAAYVQQFHYPIVIEKYDSAFEKLAEEQ